MKRSLVLSGGGSRGAYEIGAWQAMEELGVHFTGVYGTSIGALNAALVAQGDVEKALSLWEQISLDKVVDIDENEHFTIERMIARKRDLIPFLLENANHLNLDNTPLENLVRASIDESRIRSRGMQMGVMTCSVPQLQSVPMRIGNMKPGSVHDWVMASAACFPVFPMKIIDGQRYVDGGIMDNLPVNMALEDGSDEIVAVLLHTRQIHPEYVRMPWLKTIKPLHDLGGFLDFNPGLIRRGRLMGYYDAMKAWSALDGHLYTFKRVNELNIAGVARKFAFALAALDEEYLCRVPQADASPFTAAIEAETEMRSLTWRDVYIRGVEMCAKAMGFREDAIYDVDQLISRTLKFAAAVEPPLSVDDSTLRDAAGRGSRYLLGWLYNLLKDRGHYPPELLKRIAERPMEAAGAVFLKCLGDVAR